jgi:hypothetical protein
MDCGCCLGSWLLAESTRLVLVDLDKVSSEHLVSPCIYENDITGLFWLLHCSAISPLKILGMDKTAQKVKLYAPFLFVFLLFRKVRCLIFISCYHESDA